MSPETGEHLRAWVHGWAAEYPGPEAEDVFLSELTGRTPLALADAERLIRWKFRSDARRRVNAMRRLTGESPRRLADLTSRAFACNDDLGALLIVCQLAGPGPALGSVFLMAHAPDRYTVIDTRALRSLRALGLLPPGRATATAGDWLDYLTGCRGLAATVGTSLRTVDRALFQANGHTDVPPSAAIQASRPVGR